jgi:DNA-directed RNA polymerase subunit F
MSEPKNFIQTPLTNSKKQVIFIKKENYNYNNKFEKQNNNSSSSELISNKILQKNNKNLINQLFVKIM